MFDLSTNESGLLETPNYDQLFVYSCDRNYCRMVLLTNLYKNKRVLHQPIWYMIKESGDDPPIKDYEL